jgi:preprotein translocase subunit SecF
MADTDQKLGAPPPEVTIRTMKGDIQSVAAGEAAPTPEKLTAKELEKITAAGAVEVVSETVGGEKPKSKKTGVIIAVVIIVLIGLAALTYFLITR